MTIVECNRLKIHICIYEKTHFYFINSDDMLSLNDGYTSKARTMENVEIG